MNRTSKDSLFGEQLWTKLPNRKKKEKKFNSNQETC